MRHLKAFGLAIFLAFGISACNQTEEQTETIDLREGTEESADQDDGNSIDINVKADDEGNVEGELNGDIELDDRK